MNKTKIEYCHYSWNPITGCKHECPYCYARKIANRFHGGFDPHFHPKRLSQPAKVKKPGIVFVCDMGDIFSPGVDPAWTEKVLEACEQAPQHQYLFLTKNPVGYSYRWFLNQRPNWWYGVTVTREEEAKKHFNKGKNWWVSFEPLLGEIKTIPTNIGWAVIGRATNFKSEFQPEWAWSLIRDLGEKGVPVFCKNNLGSEWEGFRMFPLEMTRWIVNHWRVDFLKKGR